MDEYKVSVIIPVYNNEKHIVDCLSSITNQTISDCIEIICVDDGSSDNSIELILQENNKNVRIIRQENSGAGAARNNGLLNASAEFVMFMDGDDFLAERDSIECLYKTVDGKNVDFAFGNMYRLKNGKIIKKFEDARKWSNWDYVGYIDPKEFQFPFIHILCIYKKSFLIDNDIYYPERFRGQDVTFCASALMHADKIYHIDKAIYVHRIGYKTNNLSLKQANDYVICYEEVLKMCLDRKGWDKLAKISSTELRVFAMKQGYSILYSNNQYDRVDSVSALLKKNGLTRLLTKSQWEKHGATYWKEWFWVYKYRAKNHVQRLVFGWMKTDGKRAQFCE